MKLFLWFCSNIFCLFFSLYFCWCLLNVDKVFLKKENYLFYKHEIYYIKNIC